MRKIWMRRNSLIFDKKFDHPRLIIAAATQGLSEFKFAQDQNQQTQRETNYINRSEAKWKKPEERVVKVNWDAAVDTKNNRVGIGVVARDSNGEVLACLCTRFDNIRNPTVAEAMGLRRAAILCTELGLSNVLLEGDSLLIVNETNSGEEREAEYGCILDDVRTIMAGRTSWGIQFVYRKANNIAHKLAKIALNVSFERVWIEDNPIEIEHDISVEKLCNE